MQATGFRLGIDFGTSHTVAVLRWPDGRARPLLFDGSPMLPSAVYAEPTGSLIVGRDAVRSARMDPSRFEPNPKRRIDDGVVLLGDREVPVVEVIGTVLGVVADEARRTAGGLPASTTLTHPASWGTPRRQLLGSAATLAGLTDPGLVEEPVAAATYFLQMLGHQMADGTVALIYDLGGGTFDVSLVERAAGGFRTVAVDGRADLGGLDLDEALVRRIGDLYGAAEPTLWRHLVGAQTMQERRARQLFREDIRNAKERLSRHAVAELHIAGLDREVHLTREEFEQLARPLLAETVRLTADVLHRSGVRPEQFNGVFLVGGSTRIPLVATMVHQGLHIPPTVIEQPELVVAEGSILARATPAWTPAPSPPPVSPVSPPPTPAPPSVKPPVVGRAAVRTPEAPETTPAPRRRVWRWWAVAGAVLVAVAVAAAFLLLPSQPDLRGTARTCPVPGLAPAAPSAAPTHAPGAEPTEGAPSGFEWYVDPTGFRITVPQGSRPERTGSAVCFRTPGVSRVLAVDQWPPADHDLVAYWKGRETEIEGTATGYQHKLLDAVGNLGQAAADWQFTYQGANGVTMHVFARAMVLQTGPAYAVYWSVPEADATADTIGQFSIMSGSGFRPAP